MPEILTPGDPLSEPHHNDEYIFPMEILSVEKYANTSVQRFRVTQADGATSLITIVNSYQDTEESFITDPRFALKPIKRDNTYLINRPATEKNWGTSVGLTPEKFLFYSGDEEQIAFLPTNFGCQTNAFLIDAGELVTIYNDQYTLNGHFEGLAKVGPKWRAFDLELKDGFPTLDSDQTAYDASLGFNLPLLVKNGQTIPLENLIQDPRLMADYRNVFDFGVGKKLPAEFWLLIRKLLPVSASAGKRLISGRTVVQSPTNEQGLNRSEVSTLQKIMTEYGITEYMQIDVKGRLVIQKPLPLNRIPMTLLGQDQDDDLIVVAVDGRQENSAGMNLKEAAQLMKQLKVRNGGLGAAGEDVALVTTEGAYLNSPSRVRNSVRTSREVAGVMVFK